MTLRATDLAMLIHGFGSDAVIEFHSDGSYVERLEFGFTPTGLTYDAANTGTYTYTITGPRDAQIGLSGKDGYALSFLGPTFGYSYGVVSLGPFSLRPTVDVGSPLTNVSTLVRARQGAPTAVGFYVGGSEVREVLIRAVGPGLARFGINDAAAQPTFTLDPSGSAPDVGIRPLPAGGWSATPAAQAALSAEFARVGAFPLAAGSADQAEVLLLPPGAYTVTINPSSAAGEGAVLIEVYQVP